MILCCDLHIHSEYSFDCFCSIRDIISAAVKSRIDVVAVTDHNVMCLTPQHEALFADANISYIRGCELSTKEGAHIIGLFVDSSILSGSVHPKDIVERICRAGGLVVIPHPFKPVTGFVSVYSDRKDIFDYVLSKTALIELYNGSCDPQNNLPQIRQLARRYSLGLIGASDAHRPWHIGRSITEYEVNSCNLENLRSILVDRPSKPVLNLSQRHLTWFGKVVKLRKKIRLYRVSIEFVPLWLKTSIKKAFYTLQRVLRG